jgi:hypothetical protein
MRFIRLLVAVLVLTMVSAPALAQAPDCAPTCEWRDKQEWEDSDTESVYDAGCCIIEQVKIQAATRKLFFNTDGCEDGYCVSGIGTGAGRAWEDAPRYDISHVEWCVACPPTAVTLSDVNGQEGTPLWVVIGLVTATLFIGLLVGKAIGREVGWQEAKTEKGLDEAIRSLRIPVHHE